MTSTFDHASPEHPHTAGPEVHGVAPQSGPDARRRRRITAAVTALAVAISFLFVASFLPSGFVIRQPGPVVNTLGSATDQAGNTIPLIAVPDDVKNYPTEGSLSLTTVQVVGSREGTPNWLQLAQAWFDPSKAVIDIDDVYPKDETREERQALDTAMMVSSQHAASAAALIALDYDVDVTIEVVELTADSAAEGKINVGDLINSIDGSVVYDTNQMRDMVAAKNGGEVTLNVTRDGKTFDVAITPTKTVVDNQTLWLLGIAPQFDYKLPIDVTIQLENIGGPSAGMMFALGIIDTLTPGAMNGGEQIAGTGTITPGGTVGPIGGIQQKLYGAVEAGAEYFLAPELNCREVVGHVPDGLQVVKVSTLDEARAAVDTIATHDKQAISQLATCAAP